MTFNRIRWYTARIAFGLLGACTWTGIAPEVARGAQNIHARPNIVVIMIDDMGYGDLSCHGSPFVRTPHLDQLHDSSVRLTNFHVAPMCSPTRGQLLTGLDAMRNGSTIVASSRMMVRTDVPMLPAHLAAAGYTTGIFGKWHLGENYPHRPEDRGFHQSLWFPLQEIGSFSDYWCNDYFDPVLRLSRGQTKKFSGYCTDIFFDEAIRWMGQQKEAQKPFFCYLPLNVAHGPQWADTKLRHSIGQRFPKLSAGQIGYLAMLANADANVGKLEAFLRQHGLSENTILVFLSDNGGYALIGHYNAGMRDGKSRLAEGGHRVPCFIRWPSGGVGGTAAGRSVDGLTEVQDLLPTLLEFCEVKPLAGPQLDGISLAKPLREAASVPDRTLIVQYGPPEPFRMACVMQGSWRLLTDIKGLAHGAPELYDLSVDPLQKRNLFSSQPERAARLRTAYDQWWAGVEPATRRRAAITIGHAAQNPVVLNSAEWREGAIGGVARLRAGAKRHGVWDVEVATSGNYEIQLRRWPEESGLKLCDGAPPWQPRDPMTPDHMGYGPGSALPLVTGHLRVGASLGAEPVNPDHSAVVFRLPLAAGRTECEAYFSDEKGQPLCAAFFVSVKLLDAASSSR